jgi:hypothetical protein
LFRTSAGVIPRAIEMVKDPKYKDQFKRKSAETVKQLVDVTGLMVWFVENYPLSAAELRKNPDYQLTFK